MAITPTPAVTSKADTQRERPPPNEVRLPITARTLMPLATTQNSSSTGLVDMMAVLSDIGPNSNAMNDTTKATRMIACAPLR